MSEAKKKQAYAAKYFEALKNNDFQTFCGFVQIYSGLIDQKGEEDPNIFFHYDRWNETQREFQKNRCGKDIILKPRQIGMTTFEYVRDLFFALTNPNARIAIVGHKGDFAEDTISAINAMYDGLVTLGKKLGVSLVPKKKIDRTTKIEFANGATIEAIKCNSEKNAAEQVLRGLTVTRLHCTEVAYWLFANETMKSVMRAAKFAKEIVIESTANGSSGWYYDFYMKVMNKQVESWKCHFYPWHLLKENQITFSSDEERMMYDYTSKDEYEYRLIHEINVSKEQLRWWRNEVAQSDLFEALKDYPIDIASCFRMKSSEFLDPEDFDFLYSQTKDPIREIQMEPKFKTMLSIWEEPLDKHSYILGVDVGHGKGATVKNANRSAIVVINRYSGEIAARWFSSLIDPSTLGALAYQIGEMYNFGLIAVEMNGVGGETVHRLQQMKYKNLYASLKDEYGWNSTGNTLIKGAMLFKRFAKEKSPLIWDSELIDETTKLITNGDKVKELKGEFNDIYTAFTIAQLIREERSRVGSGTLISIGKKSMSNVSYSQGYSSMKISLR